MDRLTEVFSNTRPAETEGEAPLDPPTLDLVLSNLGTDLILVGGQALAYWMDRFSVGAVGTAISNDGDVLGRVEQALELARFIRARVELPEPTDRTALVAQLRLAAPDGRERNIDVLHKLFTISGLKKSGDFTKQVIRDSVLVEWRPGRFIRVMDPIDVLESRAQNAVGLFGSKGPHVVTQARWAVDVARAALLKQAGDAGSQNRLGATVQRIYTLSASQVGKRLLREHHIELLDAIDSDEIVRMSPQHERQLQAALALKLRRAAKLTDGSNPEPESSFEERMR